MPMPFQSRKIILVGRGSKRRLNPSLAEIRIAMALRSDMPLESEGDDQHPYFGTRVRARRKGQTLQ